MKNEKRFSLKMKLILSLILMALILGVSLMSISYKTYKDALNRQYETMGNQIARTAMKVLDADQVRSYVKRLGENPERVMAEAGYQDIISIMRDLKEANDVLYLYMIFPAEEGSYFVFDTDESEDVCHFGYFMEYYEGSFSEIVDDVLAGKMVPSVVSNQDYGWIISISYPYNVDGELLGYLCIDISMNEVVADRMNFMGHLLLILLLIIAIIALLAYLYVNQVLIKPVQQMNDATDGYVRFKDNEWNGASPISQLDVRTGDELEDLCLSLKKMEADLNNYMTRLTAVTAEKERIGAELDVATRIQANMLPCIFPAFPERLEFDIYATMNPAKEVGGDFYDFFLIDQDHLSIVMADVSGKGVPAALFMVIAKILIKNRAFMGGTTSEILSYVNEQLCDGNHSNFFVTVWFAIIEISTGRGWASNAGHENPVIKRAGSRFEMIRNRHSPALGIMDGISFKVHEFQLNPGDCIFLYTDGVPEATNAAEEMFGNERMMDSLNRRIDASPAELLKGVKDDIDEFVGEAPQFDDVTMLSLHYCGARKENS